MVVNCKSWQSGFRVELKLKELTTNRIVSGRESWRRFRELMSPKWSDAFFRSVKDVTGSTKFTYVLAVTAIRGDARLWETHKPFRKAMRGNPIRILTLSEMLGALMPALSTTVAGSTLGRTLQLLKASGFTLDPDAKGAKRRVSDA